MCDSKYARTVVLIVVLVLTKPMPGQAQEAGALGLKGKVHTVFTEDFTSEDSVRREPTGSSLDVYDQAGYQLELFRYKPDGSLWVHTLFDRKGPQVFRIQATGTTPFESNTTQNVFDAEGRVIETDTYDSNGAVVSKSKGEFVEQEPNSSTYRRTERNADGTESEAEIIEATNPDTGVTHQVETRNGRTQTDWVIQRNPDGTEKDKIVYVDGSYNESEHKGDGTTVEDRYSAVAKSHTYQKSDGQGHLIEVIEKSDSYYIRCTYSFDKEGRPTGHINYDAAGNVLDKSTVEYRDDSNGNWTEKKSIVWDTKSEPMQPKMIGISLRTINYY